MSFLLLELRRSLFTGKNLKICCLSLLGLHELGLVDAAIDCINLSDRGGCVQVGLKVWQFLQTSLNCCQV